jgi:perosamine synthetase
VTCNDEGLAGEIKLLRSHGETDKYLHESIGYNYRLNDMAGALGCSRLDRLAAQTEARRAAAARYDKIIAKIPGLKAPVATGGSEPVFHLYTMQMDPGQFTCTRDEFCKALNAEGVPTATHYPRPLPEQPALAEFDNEDCPVAQSLSQRVFCLPMHHDLTEEHFRIVTEALNKVATAYRA